MDFKLKYLKYKSKYLNLKKQLGSGSREIIPTPLEEHKVKQQVNNKTKIDVFKKFKSKKKKGGASCSGTVLGSGQTVDFITWNVCHECMRNLWTECNAGMSLGSCRDNLKELFHNLKSTPDFIAIQEGNRSSLTATELKRELNAKYGGSWLSINNSTTYLIYNGNTFRLRTTGFSNPYDGFFNGDLGRPWVAGLFEKITNGQCINVASIHAPHRTRYQRDWMNKFIPEIAKHFNINRPSFILGDFNKKITLNLQAKHKLSDLPAAPRINWYPVNTTINTCCAKPKSSSRHFGKYDNILYRKASLVSGTFGKYSSNPNVILPASRWRYLHKTSDHLPIAARFRI